MGEGAEPTGGPGGAEASGGLLVVIIDVEPEHEDELNRWYDQEHLPEKLATPGFRGARRFASIEVPQRYLAIYDVDDPEMVVSEAYMSGPVTEWTRSVQATWRGLQRSAWRALPGPGAG